MIHHHGRAAATDAITANRLRSLSKPTSGRYRSRQVQYPATKTADSQVMTALARVPQP
jgi:hypothetical protein